MVLLSSSRYLESSGAVQFSWETLLATVLGACLVGVVTSRYLHVAPPNFFCEGILVAVPI